MRAHRIWFAISLLWWIDAGLALWRGRTPQAALAALAACCFLAAGVYFQRRLRRTSRLKFSPNRKNPSQSA